MCRRRGCKNHLNQYNNCKQPTPFCTAYQNEMIGNSYSYNWSINQYNYYEGYGGATHPRKGFSTARQPAAAPMMMDGNNMNYFAYPMNYFYADADAATQYIDAVSEGSPQSGWWYAFRHPGRTANILYLDGHVGGKKHVLDGGSQNFVYIWELSEPPEDF